MNHYFYALQLLLIVNFASCKIPLNKASDNEKGHVVIELEKTACMGPCPVYSLKIFENGYMLLDAKENLEIQGLHNGKLNKNELKALMDKFDSMNFFELKDSYTSFMMDLPTKYISYTNNGNTKKIMAYDKIPAKLTALINEIDAYTKSIEWAKAEN